MIFLLKGMPKEKILVPTHTEVVQLGKHVESFVNSEKSKKKMLLVK
jgi:hypothetical protein